ncbi:EH signature domain-containing protein [Kineococcus sp. SYSU DK002]|uniref:EH signature domain-containing protein n=1 Tax=Kineococcus sp. SYSU DK002 TaxID=3383123 RepID=UPI003D7CCE29
MPQLTLSPRSNQVCDAWNEHVERVAALIDSAGTGRNFTALVADVRQVLDAGDPEAIAARLSDRRAVRAAATAWAEDAELARRTLSVTVARLVQRSGVSRLTTLLLAHLFLDHLDRLDRWDDGLQAVLRDVVRNAVAALPSRNHLDAVESLRRQDEYLFTAQGPQLLATRLVAAGEDLNRWFRDALLSAYSTTRFARVARDEFYLARIAAADAERGDHAFLSAITDEVMARQRTENTDRDGLYFGHRILVALTDKVTRRPSSAWLQAVLDIGGDPRFQQTESWRTWWAGLPEENRSRAVRWMSGLNLTAFLDGIETYANSKDESMERMLKRRKRLLNGLYEQDRIEDVRLVLGADIERWVRRSVAVGLQDVARLEGPGLAGTAVVYVNCGDFCLVEGSHNFSLHVFLGGPLERLEQRSRTRFDAGYLRDELPGAHVAQNGPTSHTTIKHHASGSWIKTALDFLRRNGVRLDEHGLMTKNDFAELAQRRAKAW